MIDSYAGGYHQCVVDLLNLLIRYDDSFIKSKKQYKAFITTLLTCMAENYNVRSDFIKYGTELKYHDNVYYIDKDTKEFKVKENKHEEI